MKTFLFYWKKYSYLIMFIFLPIVAIVDTRLGLIAIVCILAPIITSFFNGRYWCGNLCPRGSLFTNLGKSFSNHKKTPNILQSNYFRVFILLITFGYFGHAIYVTGFDWFQLGLVFCKFIVYTTLLAFVLASFYNEKTWCTFCPAGTLAMVNSKVFKNKRRMHKVKDTCTECKLCEASCPVNISISQFKGSINSNSDCLKCDECITACPHDAIIK